MRIRNGVVWAMALGLVTTSVTALADPLVLFGVPLKNASREAMRRGIAQAGGKLVRKTADEDDYAPSRLLPQAKSLKVIYLDGRLVALQYGLELWRPGAEEKFRGMLATKYGHRPAVSEGFMINQATTSFEGPYAEQAKYTWDMDDRMAVVFDKSFDRGFDGPTLSYVDRDQQAAMQERLEQDLHRQNAHDAATLNNAF